MILKDVAIEHTMSIPISDRERNNNICEVLMKTHFHSSYKSHLLDSFLA